ncbi:glycosyltransferase [Leuconostoc suionicum]|uniref:glycosyltransferase n=1 Tax=Leuconostoc suionicum TaxID=1511761 RepID=UPI00300C454D
MKKVVVLMSAYNGEKYIEEQINSILCQRGMNSLFHLSILVRDDGSTDGTEKILNKLSANNNVVILNKLTDNLGVKKSFFYLLNNAPEADLYFFSDQDDIWPQNKVERFFAHYDSLKKTDQNKAVGLYSDLWIADEFGKSTNVKMSEMYDWSRNADYQYLSWNYRVTGAAFAINSNTKNILSNLTENIIAKINMHDSFIGLIISTTGKLIEIDEPLLYYRQHESNVVGASHSSKSILQRIRLLLSTVERLENDNLLLLKWIDEEHPELNDGGDPRFYFDHFKTLKYSRNLIKRVLAWKYLASNITLNKIRVVSFVKAVGRM